MKDLKVKPYERKDTSQFTKLLSLKQDPHEVLAAEVGEKEYKAYREQWEAATRFEIETPFPTHLDFELNYSCNLRCPMCTWSVETKVTQKEDWLTLETFKRIIDDGIAKGMKSIQLNYVNEPLLRQDLPDFAAYARSKGILDIMLSTNGTVLTEKMGRRLVESGITRLMVSLDAHTQETYDKIRIGANFKQVEDNLMAFIALRNQMGSRLPLVRVSFVRMSLNEQELPQFIEYWKPHVDFFAIQEYINPLPEKGKSADLTAESGVRTMDFRCTQPWQRMVVRHDGTVLPCCTFYGAHFVVGSIYKESLESIWKGSQMRELRAMHKVGEYYKNSVCNECALNSVVDVQQK